MLRVGLTGGIGSGKSTVASAFAGLGAVVVDADRIAREVVEPGTPGLAAVRRRFGGAVIDPDGRLDRAALAAIVFEDAQALSDLEGITHPAIWRRTAQVVERALAEDPSAVVVHDMPLLVEKDMTGEYHLVVVVDAPEEVRVRRLVGRGLEAGDARARIRAQASDAQRVAAADVTLRNDGSVEQTRVAAARLWETRIVPFEVNVRTGRLPPATSPVMTGPDPTWPAAAARLLARLRHAAGDTVVTADHIGSTAVPGLVAKDVIDLQLGVRALRDADDPDFVTALAAAGFPRVEGIVEDRTKDGVRWPKRFHGSCDPGRAAHVHVREVGGAGWRWALLFRDWLRSDPAATAQYAALKAELADGHETTSAYAAAKEPWFDAADARAEAWASRAGWQPTTPAG